MTKILTNSGLWIDLLNPRPEQICLHDIAHANAMTCRYGGHTFKHYSVAQHECIVESLLADFSPLVRLHGLLHDSPEAYAGDIVTPLKNLLPEYLKIEENLFDAILQAFSIPVLDKHDQDVVHYADKLAYQIERGSGLTFNDGWEPYENPIVPWSYEKSYETFTAKFFELRELI